MARIPKVKRLATATAGQGVVAGDTVHVRGSTDPRLPDGPYLVTALNPPEEARGPHIPRRMVQQALPMPEVTLTVVDSEPMGRAEDHLTLDALLFAVRDKLGCGYSVTVCAPNDNKAFAGSRVCVSWHRLSAMRDKDGGKRVTFAADLTTALGYVLEYERRYDAEGTDAAAAWHKAETKRRELDVERLIEEARRARENGGRSS